MDQFDTITTYTWSQVEGGPDILTLSDSDTDTVSFNVSNPYGGDDKVYTLNLHVTANYPIKGGTGTRSNDAQISVTIYDEPNNAPTAPDPFEIIVLGDSLGVNTMYDYYDTDSPYRLFCSFKSSIARHGTLASMLFCCFKRSIARHGGERALSFHARAAGGTDGSFKTPQQAAR